MNIPRWTLRCAVLVAALVGQANALAAQGVTTAAVSGTVLNELGKGLEGAQVQVVNRNTGARAGTMTRADGRYYVQGLEVGGPYTVSIRRIGYAPRDSAGLFVSLGQNLRVDFNLRTQAAQLAGVQIVSTTPSATISPSHKGVSTTVTDSAIARLPTLNRNFTDFVGLTPQISTKGPGNSGAGQNNRFNAIQIDGSVANDVFGLGSTGQPGGQAGAKQISLEAIKEYQVLLSPYDVRQGYFSGFLLNAVTKSGSNDLHCSGTAAYRSEKLERNVDYLRRAPFTQKQEGFWCGGKIISDRLFFSIAPEFQQQSAPASGPYIGQPSNLTPAVPGTQQGVDSLRNVFTSAKYGYTDPGVGTIVNNDNPLANMFARLDFVNLPMNSRLVTRYNYVNAQQDIFSRSNTRVSLSNNGYNFQSKTNNGLATLFTNFANGNSNELLAGYTTIRDKRITPITAPFVVISRTTNPNGGTGQLAGGTENSSQGNELDQNILELSDNITLPWRSHRFELGTKNEFYKVRNLFAQNSYGNFTFGTIDSLINNTPSSATLGIKLDNTDGAARFHARTIGFYLSDEWQASNNLAVTMGVRLDMPGITDSPGLNPNIQNALGINTTAVPTSAKQWQPRIGFNWDVTGDQVNQLRGGSGYFMAQPAYVWLSNLFGNSGVNGYGNVTCSGMASAPAMPAAGQPAPTACKGTTGAPAVTVNTVDPNLKFPEVWRSTIGYDRRLPWNVIGTFEAMYTRSVYNFYYQNLGLVANPIGTDLNGRAMYGDITSATSNTVPVRRPIPGTTQFLGDVIHLSNTNAKDYSYNYTGKLEKRFSNSFEGSVSYTYGHAYDIYDLTSSVAFSNWSFGRSYAGRQDAQELAYSKWDSPHRIILGGTYSFPTKTDISMTMFSEAGTPFEYVYGNDMNGDNSTANDLVYVPKNAHDTKEIQFSTNGTGASALTPAMQADSLENFIASHDCLNSQRGTIMKRNSCRTPWTKTVNVSARQSLKTIGAQNFILQLDVFNFLNLLNKSWGTQDVGSTNSPTLLTRRSYVQPTAGQPLKVVSGAQPVFNFTNFSQFSTKNIQSNYALQLQVKYTF
ncbi:MAG: putative oar protein [Gemmatimonadetes bacterium]|nr:putative oar protein [Gemmatimonadota bacterium]